MYHEYDFLKEPCFFIHTLPKIGTCTRKYCSLHCLATIETVHLADIGSSGHGNADV